MTTKKYHTRKSYISLGMIIVLQCMPLLTWTSYANEPQTEVPTETAPEQTTPNTQEETLDTLAAPSVEIPTPVALSMDSVVEEPLPIVETTISPGETSTSTLITPEIPYFQSTGTSTTPSTIFYLNATSSFDSIFENATTSQEEPHASSTVIIAPGASSIELTGEEINQDENSGELPSGTTTIFTGSSVAMANILNITNTNLINSTGSIILKNLFNSQDQDVDTRLNQEATSTPCTLLSCNGVDTITTNITAQSTVDTTISLVASSGSNEASTVDAAVINTGNVYAGLNLVNIANTTLIDSQYLLLSLNSFGDFNGDIVFPSLATFFSSSGGGAHLPGFENVTTRANATVTNNLNVAANSGDNIVASSTGFTQTGSTDSSLNLYNTTNTMLVGGNSLLLLLKVTGTWLGNLIGVKNTTDFMENKSTRMLQIEETTARATSNGGALRSTSTALLTNNVEVLAESGNNKITDTNTSEITTGDAYASANIINIANTHIIGRNWILAMVTIFGDFTGDITFGRPDLWIGEQVSGESIIENETELLYRITIINKGDSNSSNVVVTSSYDTTHLTITNSSIPYREDTKGNLIFSIGDMAPKESQEIIFYAKIKESTPGVAITNTVIVKGDEKDNNTLDNTDTTTILTTGRTTSSSGGYQYVPPTILVLTTSPKTNPLPLKREEQVSRLDSILVTRVSTSTLVTAAENSVKQTIIIRNPTNSEIPSIIFNDLLLDENGKIVKKESFDIGGLLAGEEVTLTYSLSFASQASGGVYTLSSEAIGTGSQSIYFGNNGIVMYLPNKKDILNLIEPRAASTSTIISSTKVTPHIKKVTLKSFIENTLVEKAYAVDEAQGEQSSPFREASPSFQYLMLFGAFSTLRLFRKEPKRKLLEQELN